MVVYAKNDLQDDIIFSSTKEVMQKIKLFLSLSSYLTPKSTLKNLLKPSKKWHSVRLINKAHPHYNISLFQFQKLVAEGS